MHATVIDLDLLDAVVGGQAAQQPAQQEDFKTSFKG
jgi:hypothetical protein